MTGRDLISASLRLLGALAPGDNPAAQEATDGLASVNRMIDSWSNDGLIVYAITAETPLTLTPGDATVTMGALGDITTRPIALEKAIVRDGTVDFPVTIVSLAEYAAITSKSLQSTYPTKLYDDGGYPQRTLTLWPVPSAAKLLVLYTRRAITQIATLDTSLSLPPGYERALVFNGALELAPEYGKSVSAETLKGAQESLAAIKRANVRPGYLRSEELPVDQGRRLFNIYSGEYGK